MKESRSIPLRLLILISGNGSNLQAIMNDIAAQKLNAVITKVISDQPDAFGLTRAARAGISTEILTRKNYPDRKTFFQALKEMLLACDCDLIVLAGFMQILPADIVNHFEGKMINIHPSLLPKYRGLHTYQQVLDANDTQHGVSVHFVTAVLDAGPLIAQAVFAVRPGENLLSLQSRGQALEHRLLPKVIGWFADKRLQYQQNTVIFDQKTLGTCGLQFSEAELIKN